MGLTFVIIAGRAGTWVLGMVGSFDFRCVLFMS